MNFAGVNRAAALIGVAAAVCGVAPVACGQEAASSFFGEILWQGEYAFDLHGGIDETGIWIEDHQEQNPLQFNTGLSLGVEHVRVFDKEYELYAMRAGVDGEVRVEVGTEGPSEHVLAVAVRQELSVSAYEHVVEETVQVSSELLIEEGVSFELSELRRLRFNVSSIEADQAGAQVRVHLSGPEINYDIVLPDEANDDRVEVYGYALPGRYSLRVEVDGMVADGGESDSPSSTREDVSVQLAFRELPGCNGADIAPPFGVLDHADVLRYATSFGRNLWSADLAQPFGVWDMRDAERFLEIFGNGCAVTSAGQLPIEDRVLVP